jgi:hypothetical protein
MIAIHQPNYLPWLGFFDKARIADTFVLLDNVQYPKGSVINRNKIKTKKGVIWIIVPVHHGRNSLINEVTTTDTGWEENHWKTLLFNYSRASHFDEFSRFFKDLYSKRWNRLVEMNETVIQYLLRSFNLHPRIVRASDLSVRGKGSRLLVDICKTLGDSEYLSGSGAKDYLDLTVFEREGITVKLQRFTSPTYSQLFGEFVPDLSAVDYLFNCGSADFSSKSAVEVIRE